MFVSQKEAIVLIFLQIFLPTRVLENINLMFRGVSSCSVTLARLNQLQMNKVLLLLLLLLPVSFVGYPVQSDQSVRAFRARDLIEVHTILGQTSTLHVFR